MRLQRQGGGEVSGSRDFPTQDSGYTEEMQTLFAEIYAVTDNMGTPTYNNEDELIQALQRLHISELLGFEDYTMGGSEYLQSQLRGLIEEYGDIFS